MRAVIPFMIVATWCGAASAQSVEDRLRDQVRKTTIDLRAAQDSLAGIQAKLDEATKQRDMAVAEAEALKAKLAATPEAPAAPVAPPADLETLRKRAEAAEQQARALGGEVGRSQAAAAAATGTARAREGELSRATQQVRAAEQVIGLCRMENTKLVATANDILHLYQTQGFRRLLLASYEPLLGLKKVELENTVQDYEDRIRDQHFVPPAPTAPASK